MDFAFYGLLIRRSLVRAQLGEPNLNRLNNRLGGFLFVACLGLCSFCVQNRSICPKYPRGFADVRLPNAIPLPLCASLSMCGAGHANENF